MVGSFGDERHDETQRPASISPSPDQTGGAVPNGFSQIELLVAIGIMAALLGLLLPALQASRESARRAACTNNMRQIGLAIQQHAQARQACPKGAAGNGTYGFSWWVELLPFLDETSLFDQLDRRGSHCGSPVLHAANGNLVDGATLDFMLCPSSPLPPFWTTGVVETLMPSYVGISGATSHDDFPETRVDTCCLPLNDGEISGGGVLVPNRRIRLHEVSDGLSYTIAVGECSDFLYGPDGAPRRVDGGFHHGWLTGTFMVGTPPLFTTTIAPRPYNLTTIRYSPNFRDYDAPGVYSAHGVNNPLLSAHPGGINVIRLDGSVDFLRDEVTPHVLKCLATRDDAVVFFQP